MLSIPAADISNLIALKPKSVTRKPGVTDEVITIALDIISCDLKLWTCLKFKSGSETPGNEKHTATVKTWSVLSSTHYIHCPVCKSDEGFNLMAEK